MENSNENPSQQEISDSPRNYKTPLAQSGVHGQQIDNRSSVDVDNEFSAVHRQLVKYRAFLTYNTIFTICFNMAYTQFLCLLKRVCGNDGISMNKNLSNSIPTFFSLNMLVFIITYKLVVNSRAEILKLYKFMVFVYFLVVFIFAVVSFTMIATTKTEDLNIEWKNLPSISKSYFNDSFNDYESDVKLNMALTGVFYLIISLLLIMNFMLLWQISHIIPPNYKEPYTFRLSLEKGFDLNNLESLLKESIKQKLRRIENEKRSAQENVFASLFRKFFKT